MTAGSRAARAAVLALSLGCATAPAAVARDFVTLDSQRWPPFFVDDPSQPGFAAELLRTCLGEAGVEPRFSALAPERLYQALRGGALDAHVLPYEKERELFVLYGRVPVFLDSYRPVVRAGGGLQLAAPSDLDALRLGHLRGARYSDAVQQYVEERARSGNLVQADSQEQLLRLLLEGGIDAYFGLVSATSWLARQWNAAARVEILPWTVQTVDYYLVASQKSRLKDKRGLLDGFDRCLLQMQQDGRYAALKARYALP